VECWVVDFLALPRFHLECYLGLSRGSGALRFFGQGEGDDRTPIFDTYNERLLHTCF
jgi:hypothetical protein